MMMGNDRDDDDDDDEDKILVSDALDKMGIMGAVFRRAEACMEWR